MKVICGHNCSGKTKELIKESLEKDIPILVFSPTKLTSLEEKSLAYFQQKVKTLYYTDLGDYKGGVLIDDLDENIDLIIKLALNNIGINVDAFVVNND